MRLKPSNQNFHFSLGKRGEIIAAEFLRGKGYEILEKNFKFGRNEMDIIAKKKERIHFVEVKTRTNTEKGLPEESVCGRKQSTLVKIAQFYLQNKKMVDMKASFDIISILYDGIHSPHIDYIENAFGRDDDRDERSF